MHFQWGHICENRSHSEVSSKNHISATSCPPVLYFILADSYFSQEINLIVFKTFVGWLIIVFSLLIQVINENWVAFKKAVCMLCHKAFTLIWQQKTASWAEELPGCSGEHHPEQW